MNVRRTVLLILTAGTLFGAWQLVGHWLIMPLPMGVQHLLDALVGTLFAVSISVAAVYTITRQYRQLRELARIRDYLVRMESYYLRLPESRIGEDHFQNLALDEDFRQAEEELAAGSASTRTQAAVRLGILATHPRQCQPSDGGSSRYSSFHRAAAHLAAAAYSEKDTAARTEAIRSLARMADFAAERDEGLLGKLVDNLAHANRSALKVFLEELAEVVGVNGHILPGRLSSVTSAIALPIQETSECVVLHDLMRSEAFRSCLPVGDRKEDISSERAANLEEMKISWQTLCEVRDLLASALRRLPARQDASSHGWPVDLSGCFLVCADLEGAYLAGANLQSCHAQFAALGGSVLDGADLSGAYLRHAHLHGCSAVRARFWGAFLEGAGLSSAHLEKADFSRAQLEGAYLVGAHLHRTIFWNAVFQVGSGPERIAADFSRANWWDARFIDPLSHQVDRAAETWLRTLFPQPSPQDQKTGTAGTRAS